jgi:uncharacterized protein (DUF1330 family)
MSAYMVFNYDITNQEGYGQYPPAAMPSIAAHGAEVVVADYTSEPKEGSPGHVTVVLRFDSKQAALEWYESDEYQAAIPLRTGNSSGTAVLCDGFVMPR